MAFYDLFRFNDYHLFPDSYAVDRESLYRLFRPTLIQQLSQAKTVFLSCHFPAEFFVVQDLLSEWGIEYTLVTRALDRQWFVDNKGAETGHLFLALAEFLVETDVSADVSWDAPLALMMLDRHPLVKKDNAVAQFAAAFPGRSEVGYFLSFEDELITRLIDKRLLDLLLQMGANDHGLIASAMLSKRLKKMLTKCSGSFSDPETPADSAAQWFELNTVES